MQEQINRLLLFSMDAHPLAAELKLALAADAGVLQQRQFPDGETWLQVKTDVSHRHCVILANMVYPDAKLLPLVFVAETLRELGALSVGLVIPYLPYMRQDIRFQPGEVVTSRIFAQLLSRAADYLVTIDPHLHRYHSLSQIYTIPTRVLHGAPLLAQFLKQSDNVLLVGPDAESRQWVADIAAISGHPFIVGEKIRHGDRDVKVSLPDLGQYQGYTAMIIDDVISSGHTILECIAALQQGGIQQIACAAIHGIFADDSDEQLYQAGLRAMITTNTIPHASNRVDISGILALAIRECLTESIGGAA